MMNNKTAIFFDIDGTLLDSSIKKIPQSTLDMLDELSKDDNYDLYIASGRSKNTINLLQNILDKFTGFVLANGQMIIINKKTYFLGSLNYDDVNNFIMFCNQNNYSIVLLTPDKLYYNEFNEKSKNNFENYIKAEVYPLQNKKFTQEDIIEEIWLFVSNEEIDKITPIFPQFKIIKWGHYGADIIPHDMSKGKGVTKVINHMGYKLENTYCLGDGDNDVEMFKSVGTSICMANGSDKAKESADIIGFHVSCDGLMKNIKKYIQKKEI